MDCSAIVCRLFKPEEWGILRDIRLSALKDTPQFFGSNFAREKDMPEVYWRETAHSENCVTAGLFDGTQVMGIMGIATMKADASGESAVLWGTYISPAWRGRGLAKKLYGVLLAYAAARADWKHVYISHHESNAASRRATLSQGFVYSHNGNTARAYDGVRDVEMFYTLELATIRR
ncbi:MAG: GNAT family N-acetyltransferase [Rhodospirillales bacterium]|nr:GNAT family N-acetyltransferase [Alphaproteobacteria bacterium]MCB9986996.1 GNAT family N-acetyltransferase [Rhodospirillales bacterium]USO08231.1 MAG: GNAT family N-acetyltransferase [Rhodospirillales bacterium]